jgi:hypothetical protein
MRSNQGNPGLGAETPLEFAERFFTTALSAKANQAFFRREPPSICLVPSFNLEDVSFEGVVGFAD